MEEEKHTNVFRSSEQLTQNEREVLAQNWFWTPPQRDEPQEVAGDDSTKIDSIVCEICVALTDKCCLHNVNRGRTLVGKSLRALDPRVHLTDDELQQPVDLCTGRPKEAFEMIWTPLYKERLYKILDETNQNYLANERAVYINRIDDVSPKSHQCKLLQKEYRRRKITYTEYISDKAQEIEKARRSGSQSYIREHVYACETLIYKVTNSTALTIPYLMTACPTTPNLDLSLIESDMLQKVSVEDAIASDFFIENMEQELLETRNCVVEIDKRVQLFGWMEFSEINALLNHQANYTNLLKLHFVQNVLSSLPNRELLHGLVDKDNADLFDTKCAFIIAQHHILGIELPHLSNYPIYKQIPTQILKYLSFEYSISGMGNVYAKLESLLLLHSELMEWFCEFKESDINVKATWTHLAIKHHCNTQPTDTDFSGLSKHLSVDKRALHCLHSMVKDLLPGYTSSISSLDDELALALYLLEKKGLVQFSFTIPSSSKKTNFHKKISVAFGITEKVDKTITEDTDKKVMEETDKNIKKENDQKITEDNEKGRRSLLETLEGNVLGKGIDAIGHALFYQRYRLGEIPHLIRNSNQIHQLLMGREIEKELDELRKIACLGWDDNSRRMARLIIIMISHTNDKYMLKMYDYKGNEIYLDGVVGKFAFDRDLLHQQVAKIKKYASKPKIPYFVILPVSTDAYDFQGVIMHDCIVPKYQTYVMPTVMVNAYSSLFEGDESIQLQKSIEFGYHAIRHPAAAVCTFLKQKVDNKVAVDFYCYHVLEELVGKERYIARTGRAAKIVITYTKPSFSDMVTDPYMRDVIPFWIERRQEFYDLINRMLNVLKEFGDQWPALVNKRADIYLIFMLTKEEIEYRGHFLDKGDPCRSANAAIKTYKFTEDAMVNHEYFQVIKSLMKKGGKKKVTNEMLNDLIKTDSSAWPPALTKNEPYLKLNVRNDKNKDVRNTKHCIRDNLTKVRGSYYDLTMSCSIRMLGRHIVSKKVASFIHQFFPKAATAIEFPKPDELLTLSGEQLNKYQWGVFIILTHSFCKDFLKITKSLAFEPFSMKKITTVLQDQSGIEEECRLNAALKIQDSEIRCGEDWFLKINYPSVVHHQVTVTDSKTINTYQAKVEKLVEALQSPKTIVEVIEEHKNDLFLNMTSDQFTFERVDDGHLMLSTFFQMNMLPGHIEQWDTKLSKMQVLQKKSR